MKYFYHILFLSIFPIFLFAQKHDNVWLFGYTSNTVDSSFGGTVIDFNTTPPDIYYEFREMNIDITNTSMCDSAGNLLFYTNGSYVANVLGDTMQNCFGLNPGPAHESFQDNGYILDQGVLSIPVPGSSHLYYLFHLDQIMPYLDPIHGSHNFYYTLIDMSKDGGLGRVEEENVLILEDDLGAGKLTAVKHANGRDWWMLIRKYDSNEYYTILISSEGIENRGIQSIGEYIPIHGGVGQSVFSPDGTKYVHYGTISYAIGSFLNIYDFDRCTGELSNPIQITAIDSAAAGGVAISPNSRFLYVSSYDYLYQYDFWADDFIASKDTVAIYDGFLVHDFFHTRFFLAQLAPDGKIYITSSSSVPYLSVINNPDLPGDSCDVCQHCIELPTYNAFSMPNFPNYRLGASETPCEPDAIAEPAKPDIEVSVYPNPTSGVVWVEMEKDWRGAVFILYDALGREVKRLVLSEAETHISLEGQSKGVYFYEIKREGELLASGTLVRASDW